MAGKKLNPNSPAALGCLLLFALPFAGVGGFMGYRFVSSIVTWQSARGWSEAPARLTALELKRHRGNKGGVTHKVVAEYDYQFDGESYTGTRVGLFGGGDNVSNHNRRVYARLSPHFKRGQAVTAYVNPARPSQALLDREMRLGMLMFHLPFVILMGGFGIAAPAYALGGYLSRGTGRGAARRQPDEPWTQNRDWARGVARESTTKAAGWITIAILWNACCGAVLAVALAMDSPNPILLWVNVGLNVVGLGLAAHAARLVWRRWRFGRSTFEMASTPGVIGGQLAGVVHVRGSVPVENGVTARLVCLESRTTHRQGKTNTVQVTLWQDERHIAETLGHGGRRTAIPIRFTIPSVAKGADPDAERPVNWKLKLKSVGAGPDYHAEFDVPVYLTEDSQDGVVVDDTPLSPYEATPTLEALLAREGVRVPDRSDSQLTVVAPPLRSPVTALIVTLLTVVWYAIVAVLIWQGMWLIAGVMSVMGVVGLYATAECLLNGSRLSIMGDQWSATAGWWGVRKTRRFHSRDVRRISSDVVMTSSSSEGESTRWVRLVATLGDGHRQTVVASLKNPKAVKATTAELRRRAGLDQEEPAGKDRNKKPPAADEWGEVLDLPPDGDL